MTVPGRRLAYGPTSASSPTSAERSTEYQTLAPGPIVLSTANTPGPTTAPAATVVPPSRCTSA